jgi:rhamnosyltransferase
MSVDVSVCILSFNGEEFLRDLLDSVESQITNYSFEILVIDSGSSDQTIWILGEFPKVRLVEIPNEDFGHGKTRNFAAELSEAEFIVFLTQDSVPSNESWLNSMLEPFEKFENVSCVFGKQIPRPDCAAPIKREVQNVFLQFGADGSIVLHGNPNSKHPGIVANTFFSDVNSAIRRKCLIEVPFRDLPYAEDQALGIDHLNHGWLKAYTPMGSVFHSHNYSPRKYYKRKMDERIGVYEATGEVFATSLFQAFKAVISFTLKDWRFIWKDRDYSKSLKLNNFLKSPVYNFLLFKVYWLTRKPENHLKLKTHSLEAQYRKVEK